MTVAIILFVLSWCVIAYAMLRASGDADELSDQLRKHLSRNGTGEQCPYHTAHGDCFPAVPVDQPFHNGEM